MRANTNSILSQELDDDTQGHYPNYTGYIAASYVKFLESSGSRVVPIWINQSPEYYEYIVNSVNGLLIPGGAAEFNATEGYATAGVELYKLAKQKNDAGVYFPVWGTCLGFELLFVLSANQTDLRTACNITYTPMPLTFKRDYRNSKLYRDDTDGILSILEKQNVTFNNHFWCITEQELIASDIADEWHILSVNSYKGSEFISSVEHRKYPFYGVQFHPEKNAFEWKVESIPHSAAAILVGQFYGNFFISEARKNNNSFPNTEEERAALIYSYPATYTGDKIAFEQTYLFVIEQQVVTVSVSSCPYRTLVSTILRTQTSEMYSAAILRFFK
ncbi:hypothetical protein Cfor_09242 [Coptotermes formosanus]|uniref:folate gamma-glutamyl hydrolase n=1 Tax=Coptotermes formosanus TaxID=36987 RepID=A0A6L2Q763_COPFO|nr:hypothetical protein Cfor_09242 [Coptotermes formosanus]